MPDKRKTFNREEKQELLHAFGERLNDESFRILEWFSSSGKDLDKMLKTAWNYRKLC